MNDNEQKIKTETHTKQELGLEIREMPAGEVFTRQHCIEVNDCVLFGPSFLGATLCDGGGAGVAAVVNHPR